jgi:hypothetical protein
MPIRLEEGAKVAPAAPSIPDDMHRSTTLVQRWIEVLREWRAEALQQRAWQESLRAESETDWAALEGRQHFALFPRRDVIACRSDIVLQAAHDPLAARLRHEATTRDCFGCGRRPDELEWLFFQSALWTWMEQCGRAGWIVYCARCDNQVSFYRSRMS